MSWCLNFWNCPIKTGIERIACPLATQLTFKWTYKVVQASYKLTDLFQVKGTVTIPNFGFSLYNLSRD